MSQNCHFAFAVHVLSVLALHPDEAFTSAALARSVNTNAVVLRRLMSELAKSGLIETQRGPGGGSKLSSAASEISLLQVHRAVAGNVEPFGDHPNEPSQGCIVGHEIRRVLETVSARAAQAVENEYSKITLADIVKAVSSPKSNAT